MLRPRGARRAAARARSHAPRSPSDCRRAPRVCQTTTACKLVDAAASPSAAFGACFGDAPGAAAARVLMADLRAGDVVLSTPAST